MDLNQTTIEKRDHESPSLLCTGKSRWKDYGVRESRTLTVSRLWNLRESTETLGLLRNNE